MHLHFITLYATSYTVQSTPQTDLIHARKRNERFHHSRFTQCTTAPNYMTTQHEFCFFACAGERLASIFLTTVFMPKNPQSSAMQECIVVFHLTVEPATQCLLPHSPITKNSTYYKTFYSAHSSHHSSQPNHQSSLLSATRSQ